MQGGHLFFRGTRLSIIGNGDVFSRSDAEARLHQSLQMLCCISPPRNFNPSRNSSSSSRNRNEQRLVVAVVVVVVAAAVVVISRSMSSQKEWYDEHYPLRTQHIV